MADDRMSLLEAMRKAGAEGDTGFLRQGVQVLAEAVMEAEVTELTGVAHGVRDPEHRVTGAQRLPRAPLGHPRGDHRPGHPAGP